jgi:ATP-binding cassette subfamily F protein uup
VSARRKRNTRRLANLHALRRQRKESAGRRTVTMTVPKPRSPASRHRGGRGVEGARRPHAGADLSTRILRGDRLGIVGPNGAGKTTLLNILTGALSPDEGRVRLGANVEMTVLDQRRESLRPDWTVAETLTGGRGDTVTVGGATKHVIGYMKDFLFSPEQARTPVSVLSGGERNRLVVARALARPSNLLVLDEPTNDLDLETLDLLQEMLTDYAGTVLLVSHDRDFLDRTMGSVLMAEGGGAWVEYAGGYSDMVAQRGAGVSARHLTPAARPPASRAERRDAASPKRKLSFNERHDLERLPGRIGALEGKIAELQGLLADPALFARDRARFDRASAALSEAQGELAAAEDRWLALEMLREELED